MAIVFAALLVLGQTLGISTPAFPTTTPPPDCTCGKSCCITDAPSPSAPVPATPATPSSAQLSSAILAPFVSWSLPAEPISASSFSTFLPAIASGVALYQRHCSYLI